MRLVCIADTHGLHDQVRLPPGDVLLHAGDVSCHGRLDEIGRFLSWFGRVGDFRHRVMIAGNHDFAFERTPHLAEGLIPDNVTYLKDSGVELDGVRFWGSPVTPEFMRWAFNRTDEELRQHWGQLPAGVDVVVTHGPPRGVLDRVLPEGQAVGCPHLGWVIEHLRPRVHVFGHIHEGYGREKRGGVQYLNAAVCDARYRVSQPPQVVDVGEMSG
ncbi:metallophosphoesterase family protein [Deinococcus aestuarii]|uniref:metallophosphoesterase family protein n=1 Tax=Deinococcus aestuarii TaxID=2774531 RepID=UPI001C0D1450|nr:metallophosphatase domain-containing protein [Deinococcus aestuarii]